jgi:hypothetical protein
MKLEQNKEIPTDSAYRTAISRTLSPPASQQLNLSLVHFVNYCWLGLTGWIGRQVLRYRFVTLTAVRVI